MTRFGVMRHLRVIEQAGLVVTRKGGREKLRHLNPMPIRLVHDRWVNPLSVPAQLQAAGRSTSVHPLELPGAADGEQAEGSDEPAGVKGPRERGDRVS
jgi:hypothetical protein